MIFDYRKFSLSQVKTKDGFPILLRLCCHEPNTGFKVENLYFLNDSASPQSIQEYAVLVFEDNRWYQIDSLSVSLMTLTQVENKLLELLKGNFAFKVECQPDIQLDESTPD